MVGKSLSQVSIGAGLRARCQLLTSLVSGWQSSAFAAHKKLKFILSRGLRSAPTGAQVDCLTLRHLISPRVAKFVSARAGPGRCGANLLAEFARAPPRATAALMAASANCS